MSNETVLSTQTLQKTKWEDNFLCKLFARKWEFEQMGIFLVQNERKLKMGSHLLAKGLYITTTRTYYLLLRIVYHGIISLSSASVTGDMDASQMISNTGRDINNYFIYIIVITILTGC